MQRDQMRAALLMLSVLAACAPPPLPVGVTALHGIGEGLPEDDLAPFDAVVGDAHFVGIGEVLHTVGAFTQSRVRLIEHLVARRGFRVIGIEWERVAAEAAESFMVDGDGTPEDVAARFSVWANTSFAALLRWLRAWNVAHPDDRVHFGFDVQEPMEDKTTLTTFLQRAAPADAPSLIAGLGACSLTLDVAYDASAYASCQSGLMSLRQYFADHADVLGSASSAAALRQAEHATDGLAGFQGMAIAGGNTLKLYEARDSAMASVFLSAARQDYPGARIALWAANAHLEYDHAADADGLDEGAISGARLMGSALAGALGRDYVAIGTIAYKMAQDIPSGPAQGGGTTAASCGPVAFAPSDHNLESMLHQLDRPYLFVDLSKSWLPASATFTILEESMVPRHQFAGLVYIDESPAMIPVGRPPCTSR